MLSMDDLYLYSKRRKCVLEVNSIVGVDAELSKIYCAPATNRVAVGESLAYPSHDLQIPVELDQEPLTPCT
jgi:hypothetical protein